jgi:integrase
MPVRTRVKTKYAGVYYVVSKAIGSSKPEKVYYIIYRRQGKLIEEKAGRQYQDDMTPARASNLRTGRIEGKLPSNKEKRLANKVDRQAELNKWTIDRLWQQYKESKPNIKGIVTDQNRFDLYISPNFGSKEPSELVALDVHRLRVQLLKKKSGGTVKNVLELLRRIINFGSKNNLSAGINFIIEMPKVDNVKTEDLSSEQLESLLKAIEVSDNYIAGGMMLTALYSGMRRGEMFKLCWDDIDYERRFIYLRDPKGSVSQKIPLNGSLRKVFKELPQISKFVFPGKGGGQLVDISKSVNKIKAAAGIPKNFRALHGLRHVYATMLASSGKVDMYTLQKLLTHKSPQMTQRYAHLRDEALRDASDLADDIISSAMQKNKFQDS